MAYDDAAEVIEQAVQSADWLCRVVVADEPFVAAYRRWLTQLDG